jgi:excisionase family DNA binding protein
MRTMEDKMNVKEVASYTGLSIGTVYNLVSQKKIPFQRISEKKVVFDRTEIDVWLTERRQGSLENEIVKSINTSAGREEPAGIDPRLPDIQMPVGTEIRTPYDPLNRIGDRKTRSFWKKSAYAAAILAVFALGWMGAKRFYIKSAATSPDSGWIKTVADGNQPANAVAGSPEIKDLQIIPAEPDSDEVRIKLDRSQRIELRGEAGSESIMPFLLKALNTGTEDYATRSKTIDVIKPYVEDSKVRQTLLGVMKTDKNPAIRMKALSVLSKVARTAEVKDAILDRLINDEDEAIRFKSLEILEDIVDAQIASALMKIKNADRSEMVRKRAETIYRNHMEKVKTL